MNINAARTTEASAPTANEYDQTTIAGNTNCQSLRLVKRRTTKNTSPPIKVMCSPLITSTWNVPPSRNRSEVTRERL